MFEMIVDSADPRLWGSDLRVRQSDRISEGHTCAKESANRAPVPAFLVASSEQLVLTDIPQKNAVVVNVSTGFLFRFR